MLAIPHVIKIKFGNRHFQFLKLFVKSMWRVFKFKVNVSGFYKININTRKHITKKKAKKGQNRVSIEKSKLESYYG